MGLFLFFFFNHIVGSQSFPCLEPCFLHFPAQISGTFSDFCGLAFGSWSLPDISWDLWPLLLSWALLVELGWSPEGQAGPGNQPEILPTAELGRGQRRKPVGGSKKNLVLWSLQESQDLQKCTALTATFWMSREEFCSKGSSMKKKKFGLECH